MTAIPLQKAWKAKRRQPERSLHNAVANMLDCALPSNAYWFPVPSGAHMSPIHAAMMKRTGQLLSGVPDIAVVWKGRAIFIELKAGRNSLSDEQKAAHGQITIAGGVVSVCRSVDEAYEFLSMLQIPMRARLQ